MIWLRSCVIKVGLLAVAAGGTLFLDEVGELPLEAQTMLLRFLQRGEVRRLGATETIRVDVRLISATHRNLAVAVESRRLPGRSPVSPPSRRAQGARAPGAS